jgi:hypothetical protein
MLQPTKEPDVNELDTGGEPTAVAKERDETNETIVVPDAGPIQAVELAWSSEDETEDYDAPTERHTWGTTWSNRTFAFRPPVVMTNGSNGTRVNPEFIRKDRIAPAVRNDEWARAAVGAATGLETAG